MSEKPPEAFVKWWNEKADEIIAAVDPKLFSICCAICSKRIGALAWRAAQADAYEQAAKIAEPHDTLCQGDPSSGYTCGERIAAAIRERAKE